MRIYPLIQNQERADFHSTQSAFLFNLLSTGTKAYYQSSWGGGGMALIPLGGKESDVSEMLYNDEYLPASSAVALHLADFWLDPK